MTSPRTQASDQAAARTGMVNGAMPDGITPPMPDIEALSRNAGQFVEALGRSAARMLSPEAQAGAPSGEINEAVRTLGQIAEAWMSDPNRSAEAQAKLSLSLIHI